MGLFNGYEKEIETRQKALEEYRNIMMEVSRDADKVLSLIPSIIEALTPYEHERKQFVDAVINALGVESTVSPSAYGSTTETTVTESYPKLSVKTNKLALGDDGNLYIGFDRRKARNGGNAAPVWLKHLTSSYKGVNVSIRYNWFGSGLLDKYLLVLENVDEDLVNDLAELDFSLTPEEAIEAQRFGVTEPVEVVTPEAIVTPVEIVTEAETIADIYA